MNHITLLLCLSARLFAFTPLLTACIRSTFRPAASSTLPVLARRTASLLPHMARRRMSFQPSDFDLSPVRPVGDAGDACLVEQLWWVVSSLCLHPSCAGGHWQPDSHPRLRRPWLQHKRRANAWIGDGVPVTFAAVGRPGRSRRDRHVPVPRPLAEAALQSVCTLSPPPSLALLHSLHARFSCTRSPDFNFAAICMRQACCSLAPARASRTSTRPSTTTFVNGACLSR
jgi:hypothetical protein